jgi:hypothetical protein
MYFDNWLGLGGYVCTRGSLMLTIGRFSSVNGSKCKAWGVQLANALKRNA